MTAKVKRWTQDELDEVENKQFITFLLREKMDALRSTSIVRKKISEALIWLYGK